MELADHTALITGGTAGIGWESARLMAAEGADVIISGRDRERGEAAAERIGAGARFVQADLSDMDSVKSLVRQCGNVDIVVNNAANFTGAATVDQDVAMFESIFCTNVRGAYFLVAGIVPGMLARGRGSIVNITSMVASKGVAGCIRIQRLEGGPGVVHPHLGRRIRKAGRTGQQRRPRPDPNRRRGRRVG